MCLFDTNIFLEILLSQSKSEICKKTLSDNMGLFVISDFSLHSIGVILFRLNKESVFNHFAADILAKIELVSLSNESTVKEFQLGIKTQVVEKVTVDKDWFMNL